MLNGMASRKEEEPEPSPMDSVAKMLRLPFGTPEFISRMVEGSINETGRRTLYMLITTWDVTGGGPFAASIVATAGVAKTAEIVQDLVIAPVFTPLLRTLGADQIALRASLCASALIGLGIMRYAVRADPLHSMKVDDVVDAMAPTLQRYLVGDIS